MVEESSTVESRESVALPFRRGKERGESERGGWSNETLIRRAEVSPASPA